MVNNKKAELVKELIRHFREKRDILRIQWVEEMNAKKLLEGLSSQEIETESTMSLKCLMDLRRLFLKK